MKAYHLNPAQSGSVHSRPTSPSPSPAKMSDPTKTLLIVDDDPIVRDVEAQVLRLQGYTVLEAQGAADALRLAREAAAIHLLITDFSMPEVDGLELTRRWTEVAGVAVSAFVYYRKRDFGRNEF